LWPWEQLKLWHMAPLIYFIKRALWRKTVIAMRQINRGTWQEAFYLFLKVCLMAANPWREQALLLFMAP
jgi:hypothetical protein